MQITLFKVVGKNVFNITFATEANKQKALDRRPWLFDNHILVLN